MNLTITFIDNDGIEQEMPARYIVCDRCEGHGTHTNPAVDSQGLCHALVNDHHFMQNYRNGVYDITCTVCNGKRVELVPDEEECEPSELDAYYRALQEVADMNAEMAAELRFGA